LGQVSSFSFAYYKLIRLLQETLLGRSLKIPFEIPRWIWKELKARFIHCLSFISLSI